MSLDIGIHGSAQEHGHDDGAHDDADNLQAGQPLLVVPADGLEHAPETVVQVQPDGDEPNNVQSQDPLLTEGIHQQEIRIANMESAIRELRNSKKNATDRWLNPLIAAVVSGLIAFIFLKVGLK